MQSGQKRVIIVVERVTYRSTLGKGSKKGSQQSGEDPDHRAAESEKVPDIQGGI